MTLDEMGEMADNLTKVTNEEELSESLVKFIVALDSNCSEKEIKDALKSDNLSDLFKALNLDVDDVVTGADNYYNTRKP